MYFKSKKYLLAILLIAALFISLCFLAACGEKSTKQNSNQLTPEGNDGVEKIVRICASFPLQADPGVGSNSIEAVVQFNLYDAMVFPDIDGTILPHVAETWDVSNDGMSYTFHIRQGIKFHDGSELTANDVAFSMNRLLAIGEGFAYLYTPYVKEAVVIDEYTVEFQMKQTFGPFVASLVRMAVLNEKVVMANLENGNYGDFGDYGKKYLLTHDAGSGPYKMIEMQMEEYMLAERYKEYWLGWSGDNPEYFKPMAVNDPATIRTLMSRHELEITDEWQAVENLQAMAALDGITVPNMYTGALVNLEMNTRKAPTDDIHFRKALAWLFDYNTATTSIYPNTKQAVGPVSASYAGHNPDVFQYSFNIDKAQEELDQSKYADKLADYPIDIAWSADVPDEEKLCLLLQQACAQIGITLNVKKASFATLIADSATIDTTSSITIMYPSDSYGEAGAVLNLRYHSATTGTFQQYEWLKDPQIDAAIEAALAEINTTSRLNMYKKIQSDLVDICPTISVLEWPEMRAYQSGYLYWPEAEQALSGGINAPIMGRSVYLRTMKFIK
ncbi:MAG: ABC transporter substrate-binding protein [Firmicutes bacterium]|nr:ABC transporter substrate-binding protein [Bacillota bacterium]